MTTRRTLGLGAVTLLLTALLAGCFPFLPGGNPGGNPGGGEVPTLSGTWSGTDSDEDVWEIEF